MRHPLCLILPACTMVLLQCAPPQTLGMNKIFSTRQYLASREAEDSTASWNTYLIIPTPPRTKEDTTRYVELHRAFKTVFLPKESEKIRSDQAYLNVVYWLVDTIPGTDTSDLFFVRHYDYERAAGFVRGLKDWNQSDELLEGFYLILDSNPILSKGRESWSTLEKYDLRCSKPGRVEADLRWMKNKLNQYQPLKMDVRNRILGLCL